MTHNGLAIWGGCVTRREHRAESWYFSQKAVTVQACLPVGREGTAHFLPSGYKFY